MILKNTFSFQWEGKQQVLHVKYVQKDTPWYLWIFGRRYQEGGYYLVENTTTGAKFKTRGFIGSPDPVKAFEKVWEVALNMLDDHE